MQSHPFQKEFVEPIESMGFSRFDLDYWKTPQLFSAYISGIPDTNAVIQQIKNRSNFKYRTEISSILKNQYKDFDPHSKVFGQITKLEKANAFTVICAHQPCLLGGPMFWVYKILSTIKLCKTLSQQYPDYDFIPVYFSGNEDHDFEEINHLQVFQNKIVWQAQSGMACGRLPLTTLPAVIVELENLFQRNEKALQFFKKNLDWINRSKNYADYFRYFVDELFGESGLIYFNPDDKDAKSLFSPVIAKELQESFIFQNTLETNSGIQSMQYPLQVNPRELNLFYHHASGRKRLIKKDGSFHLVDSEVIFNEAEILQNLKNNPDDFSPNVLMRPLYQEFIFPNIAFVGGGGEIAYWMQLKKCFELTSIPYPILFRRFSAFYFDESLLERISKLPFKPVAFLQPIHEIEKAFIKLQSNVEDNIDQEVLAINELLDKIRKSGSSLDASTKSSIESELQKINKSLEHIISKRNKVLKQKHDQDIQNIRKIKEILFPDNTIQERSQSFLPYYFKYGIDFLNFIEDSYEPNIHRVGLIIESSKS